MAGLKRVRDEIRAANKARRDSLLKKAEQEDGCLVSVGGLVGDLECRICGGEGKVTTDGANVVPCPKCNPGTSRDAVRSASDEVERLCGALEHEQLEVLDLASQVVKLMSPDPRLAELLAAAWEAVVESEKWFENAGHSPTWVAEQVHEFDRLRAAVAAFEEK